MKAVKILVDVLVAAGLSGLFLLFLTPFFAPVTLLNAMLWLFALVLAFGGWGRKLLGLATVFVAGAATISIPFLQGGRTVLVAACPKEPFACVFPRDVSFADERGRLITYPDPVRAQLAMQLAKNTVSVFPVAPVKTADGWALPAPTESRRLALATIPNAPVVRYTLDFGVAPRTTVHLKAAPPEADGQAGAGGLDFTAETGLATARIDIELDPSAESEGFFAVRLSEPPKLRDLERLLKHELVDQAIESGVLNVDTAEALSSSGGWPAQIIGIALHAQQKAGLMLAPETHARLARLCRVPLPEPRMGAMTIAQASVLTRVVGQPAGQDGFRAADTLAKFCPGSSILKDLQRAPARAATEEPMAPAWLAAIEDAASAPKVEWETIQAVVSAAPLDNARKAYVACNALIRGARSASFEELLPIIQGADPEFNAEAMSQVAGDAGLDEIAQSVAQRLSPLLQDAISDDGAPHRAARRACEDAVEALGPFDPLTASIIEPRPPARVDASARINVLASRAASTIALIRSGNPAAGPDSFQLIAALTDAPALRDPLVAGWTLDQRLTPEQATALIRDPANFPAAAVLVGSKLPWQLPAAATTAERTAAAIAEHNARALVVAAETRATDLSMASLVYALKLLSTRAPDPPMARRFQDEIGGDPEWVCVLLADRGLADLCRPLSAATYPVNNPAK